MKVKKLLAIALSLCMLYGEASYGVPFIKQSITAQAATTASDCYSFDYRTRVLTLRGNVDRYAIYKYSNKSNVKKIIAERGTVFPKNCESLFYDYSNCTSIDLSNADTSNVTDMHCMFRDCSELTTIDVSGFDTRNVTNMASMFWFCKNLRTLDVSNFDTSRVTNMSDMFSNCENLTSLDLRSFDTSNVTDMSFMFYSCEELTSLDVSSFDTSNVKDMDSMFEFCFNLTELDLSRFDTGRVTAMHYMFNGCKKLTSLDLRSFDTSNVTNMSFMFSGCEELTSLDVSSFDTSNVTDMNYMFCACEELTSLDISSFDTSNVKDGKMARLLSECPKLRTLTLGKNFKKLQESAYLPNGKGWMNVKSPSKVISGDGDFAVIENNGKNTYKLLGSTYPQNITVTYSQTYHQATITWDRIEGADRYAIAVYLAGKWKIQTQNINTNSYTTPKNSITPDKTYKVAVAAKIDGEWDTANAIKNAVTVSIDPLHPANVEYVNLINIPSGHSNQPDYLVSLVKSKMYDDEIFFAQAEGVPDTGGFLVTNDLKNQLNNLENDYQGHLLSTWASTEEAAAHAAKGETDQLVPTYFDKGSNAYYGCWAYNYQHEINRLNYYSKIFDQALQSYTIYLTLTSIYQSRMIAAQQEAMEISQQEYLEMYRINNVKIKEYTIKNKHLSGSGDNNWSKFNVATPEEANLIVQDAIKNGKIISIVDNGKLGSEGQYSYRAIIDTGKVIGTKGETHIKLIYDDFDQVWTVYSCKIP